MDPITLNTYRNRIYGYFTSDARFTVGGAGSYVNYTYKGRYLPTSLYPSLSVYFASKSYETHRAIGYIPWVGYIFRAECRLMVPIKNEIPSTLLTDSGLSEIKTLEDVEVALIQILCAMEDVLRFDGTSVGMSKRRLEDPTKVLFMLPGSADIDMTDLGNSSYLCRVVLNIDVQMKM